MDKIKNGNTFKVEHCSFVSNLICGNKKAKDISKDKLIELTELNK